MFGACYKQPLKPSGSEPPAEEILSQSTFTEHLLRAICRRQKGVLSRPQESILGSLARKNSKQIHSVSLVMCVRPLTIIPAVTCMCTFRWPETREESQKK
uniref:ANKRD13C divergent transcript n=1 Tax=Nomascus leucogenys TaxID=61853 RepID=A0A2I3GDU8_NOMLE